MYLKHFLAKYIFRANGFLPFTTLDDPYLNFFDFSQLLVVDTPTKSFLSKNLVYTFSQHILDTQYKKKIFLTKIF